MPTVNDLTAYLERYVFAEDTQLDILDNTARPTIIDYLHLQETAVPIFINEYWTSRQRQTASIQEISYRACFKPQLPRFFIEFLTGPGDTVYDPFAGRGTTVLEAALLGRKVAANDINPLSKILTEPRLDPPLLRDIERRLAEIPSSQNSHHALDLSMFYHPQTEAEILSLRDYLYTKSITRTEDHIDRWIRMVATNRLSGHSKGFFSVYTMPPNQAVSAERQSIINRKRNQKPEYRNTRDIIIKKSKQLMRNMDKGQIKRLKEASQDALFLEKDASRTCEIGDQSINLTVTSPPFLNVVQYSSDNWLRCWFNCIEMNSIEKKITMAATLKEWETVMKGVFKELFRVTSPGGWVAFEVGEVRNGKINLEETVVPLGLQCGFTCAGVMVNRQNFTKTSNIWGIKNNQAGTNSNRIVLFTRPG